MEENRTQDSICEATADIDMQAVAQTAGRLGRKKALAVARDMLRQQGVDDAAADELLAGWAEQLEQPEKQGERMEAELRALREHNERLNRRVLAAEMGVPSAKAERYLLLAESYPEAAEDFGRALARALEEFPAAEETGSPELPSFAAKTLAPRAEAALSRAQIERMSPRELAAHWGEVERYLEAEKRRD